MYEECEIMDVKIKLMNLNDFIKDVYNQPIKLSDILKSNSFSEGKATGKTCKMHSRTCV